MKELKEFLYPEIEIIELFAEDIMVESSGEEEDLPEVEGGLGWG